MVGEIVELDGEVHVLHPTAVGDLNLRTGDVVAIESPTYFGILQIIEMLGLRACEVPTNPKHGVCLDDLASRLTRCRVKACVFMTNYSNPLGSCIPDPQKQQLVELLARREIPLIEMTSTAV